MLLEAQRLLSGGKAGLSLLLPGFMGVQLHSKGSDGKREDKLLSEIAALEIDLLIPMGEWVGGGWVVGGWWVVGLGSICRSRRTTKKTPRARRPR